jgi:hypothetical protein
MRDMWHELRAPTLGCRAMHITCNGHHALLSSQHQAHPHELFKPSLNLVKMLQ